MRVALMLLLLLACGPGLKPVEPNNAKTSAGNALATAVNDVDEMTRMLRGVVVNGGLWFSDPGCASKFTAGEIDPKHRGDFARCLVGLHLKPSPREDALGDVVVLTYEPGFEVEARVVSDLAGPPALMWIGFASKRAQDKLPTISGAALEALREAGDRDGPIDPRHGDTFLQESAREEPAGTSVDKHAVTWLKVCLDETGAVTELDPYSTSSQLVQEAFVDAARAWKFRPFKIGDQAIPVCAMTRMSYPPRWTEAEVLPLPPPPSRSKRVKKPLVLTNPRLVEGHRIAGTKLIVPDDLTKVDIHKSGLGILKGTFRVCVDDQGLVESVVPLKTTGVARYDARLIAGMQQWRYSPYMVNEQPVPVCTAITFIYKQDGVRARSSSQGRMKH